MSKLFRCALFSALSLISCGTDQERPSLAGANVVREPTHVEFSADARAEWQATVARRISDSSFAIERDGEGFVTASSTQRFRAAFGTAGVELWARDQRAGAVKIGGAELERGDARSPLAAARLSLGACRADGAVDAKGECLRRLEGQRGSVTELWENRPDGLEHSFIVHERPEGTSELSVRVSVENAEVTLDAAGESATFVSETAGLRLSYSGLKVWDDSGMELVARMERVPGGLALVVDDDGAEYPITIDPVLAVPDSFIQIDQHRGVGMSVDNAGDVNGDGFDDVILSASEEDKAFLYLGGPAGPVTSAAWVVTGVGTARSVVAGAGDVNGDGFDDIAVGDPEPIGTTESGRVAVYHGGASGPGTAPAWTAEGVPTTQFGYAVAGAGDVDNDGFDDLIVGAYQYSNGHNREGAVFLYRGSASGLDTSAAWSVEANRAESEFGSTVESAGDVNGDGFGDILVGAPRFSNGQTTEGRAFVFHGSATGPSQAVAWVAESNQAGALFGFCVDSAGDVNGDGFDDVVIGAPGFDVGTDTTAGRAFVYHGSAAGLAASAAWNTGAVTLTESLGLAVAGAGDVNDDGFSDVVIGIRSFNFNAGQAWVYHGGSSGLSTTSAWVGRGFSGNTDSFGLALSSGDFNGDGFSDLLASSPSFVHPEEDTLGRVLIFNGSPTGLITPTSTSRESNQAGAQFGESVAGAGDVNGDGFDDVIVGAWLFDNGQTNEGRAFVYHGGVNGPSATAAWTVENNQADSRFGYSVAGAGDVNGDGFDDVIIGAHYFDNGQTDEGRAYIYHGSASGLSGTAARTVESNQVSARFGSTVASAGDVNGDGFGDVIVGAHLFDNGQADEGRAFVYLGSATGIGSSAAWVGESNQVSANYGVSASGAGDVNGDGFDDVIVGAYLFDNGQADEGRAFVYLGGATGLSITAAWTAESNQVGAAFGRSVDGAGDLDGDGFDDVIVGVYSYDTTFANAGRVEVYLGTAGGLETAPNWFANGAQLDGSLGGAVAGAGDVNADGLGDVLVGTYLQDNGQTDEGMVQLYLGSLIPEGFSADAIQRVPAFSLESNQANARMGFSVDGAGDVNGDGYADLIIGSYMYDSGQTDEGRVQIIF